MFYELDIAIETILNVSSAPAMLKAAEIDFDTPKKDYAPNKQTVNLFLLEVKENRILRDPQPILSFTAGTYTRKQPPVRVDVTYVVTAWPDPVRKTPATTPLQEEHNLLAQALGWLSTFPVIPPALLPNQPFPVVMFTALPDERLNIGEFWSALGIPPRAAFTLTATIALDYSPAVPAGPPVISKEMEYRKLIEPEAMGAKLSEGFEIAGTITQNGLPVDQANVQITQLGWSTFTDADGRYRFSILQPGRYTLRAAIAGSRRQKTVNVPPVTATEYDFRFP